MCRIIMKFGQNTISGPETYQIGPKVLIWSCPDLSRRTHMGPNPDRAPTRTGPSASSKNKFWIRNVRNLSKSLYGKLTLFPRPVQENPYGPIRAHMGPYGAHMGPYTRKFPKIPRKFLGIPRDLCGDGSNAVMGPMVTK